MRFPGISPDHLQDISEAAVEQSDQLNGNAQPLGSWAGVKTAREKTSMGITKGTVMDKVTNIFSSSHSDTTIMGNSVNKEKEKDVIRRRHRRLNNRRRNQQRKSHHHYHIGP